MIAFELFSMLQEERDFAAISYAVMDTHDYLDQSCNVHVDSIEVFFDATDPMLIVFVDALLDFEIAQEAQGESFVGYISLRFTGPTRALLGQQRFDRTCAIEVAGLKDVPGVTDLIDFAIAFALNPNVGGILHWGQRNEATRADIQARFGDRMPNPTGDLRIWRSVLSRLTEHGRLEGFSNAFTRQTGLEVVTPRIGGFELVGSAPPAGGPITVEWDCAANPPITSVRLVVEDPGSNEATLPLDPSGQVQVTTTVPGTYTLTLVATIDQAGEARTVTKTRTVTVA